MRKIFCLFAVVVFFIASTTPTYAHRRHRGGGKVSWQTLAGVGIVSLLIGYVASRKSDIQEKGIDEEYRTQRYKIDADTTLAAPSALGDRESSEWDRPREGKARIYSPLPVRRVGYETSMDGAYTDAGMSADAVDLEADRYTQSKSSVDVPSIADLVSLYRSLPSKVTQRERRALMRGTEEVRDPRKAAFSRSELRSDLDHLHTLKEKILDHGARVAEVAALEKLIRYIEVIVFKKRIS